MTKIAVVLAQGFADWECAHLMGAGRAHLGLEVVTASPDGQPVVSMGGLNVVPDMALDQLDAEAIDGIVVCGGTIWQSQHAPDLSEVVGRFSGKGRLVGAICDGVLGLARTGALDGVRHTGNDLATLETASGYAGSAGYVDTPAAFVDGKVVTASGLAPVSFMVEVLSALGYEREMLSPYQAMLGAEHSR